MQASLLRQIRGTVVNNVDPKGQGRIQVLVPQIMAAPLASWAMMCTPVGGIQHGMFAVPPPKAGVLGRVRTGDIDYPIWTGCFPGDGFEIPKQAPDAKSAVSGHHVADSESKCVVIDDAPVTGGVVHQDTRWRKNHRYDIGFKSTTKEGLQSR